MSTKNYLYIFLQVGVGDGDMGALTQLDSDRARLCSGHQQAVRDIVQFIRKLSTIWNYSY